MAGQKFRLVTDDFEYAGQIPREHTCDGQDRPPQLRWMHPPAGAKSFALIMDDPDAPNGVFTHWVQYDIPADATSAGDTPKGLLGRNDFHYDKYGGPCPPANHGDHRYFFKLYALDVESLGLNAGAPRSEVESAMEGHILDEAVTMGRYSRRTA